MKILVYGAGVVGSYFAARLKEKGHKVSILARSKRLLQVLEHGIVLEDALTGRRTVTGVDAVERLASRDVYDLVIAAVRKNQVKEILPVLARHRELVLLMLRAIKEGFVVVKALGYPLTPRKSAFIKWLPEYWLARLIQKRLHSKAAEIALAGHALNAVDEMKHLSTEFQTLVEQAELHSPAILQLHRGITIL